MECLGTITGIVEQFIEAICGTGTRVTLVPDIPQLNESLYEFYRPADGTTPNVEIVFFHGLQRGDYTKAYVEAWTSFAGSTCCCWPKTLLAEEFPRSRILSVSYDSSVVKGERQGRLDLYRTAENLLQDLTDMQGKVAEKDGCPLILIGQDLGGLIIKAICMRASWKAGDNKRYRSFLKNLKGILYYSTPHLGISSWPANWNGALAKNLGLLNADISRLNEDFRYLRQQNKWTAKEIVAAYPSKQSQFEVTETSARYDVDDFYTANEDIDTVCKLQSRISISFRYLTQLISHCVSSESETLQLTGKVGSLQGPEQTELVSQSYGIGCMKFKSSLHFEDDNYYVPMQRTIAEVRTALKTARIVVLHGGPGSGKSSLARYLALRFEEESHKQDPGVASTSDQVSPFPDGVVYITCGNGAQVIRKQQELLRKFRMEVPLPELTGLNVDEARQRLREKLVEHLRELRALVILDDVWDRDVVHQLLVPGGKVKYLVTTQISTLWIASDSERVLIQDVPWEDALQILGNYANFDGGLIPEELVNLADDIIYETESHPLALATLAMVVDSGDRTSIREWQDLKSNLREYLTATDYAAISFGESYPLSVHASMMFMLDLLDDDAKKLLYTIVLFDGPSISEAFVRLFLTYTQPQGSVHNINRSRKTLEARGLVEAEQDLVSEYLELTGQERALAYLERAEQERALSIHGLRHEFILMTKMDDIYRVTNFLASDKKYLHLGERSGFDMAIALCTLYGVTPVKKSAVEKMGVHFIWSADDFGFIWLAAELRLMVCLMFSEGETTTCHKSLIARAATEVFWKLFTEGELDDHNIVTLLEVPEWTAAICAFLAKLNFIFNGTSHEFSVVSFPSAINSLLLLLSNDAERWIASVAIETFAAPSRNTIPLAQFPGCLERLVGLLDQNLTESIQERALVILANLSQFENQVCTDMLATPLLLERLVMLFSKNKQATCLGAALVIMNLARPVENQVMIVQFPSFLNKLAGLLVDDVEKIIQQVALGVLKVLTSSCETNVCMDILRTHDLIERLVMFLSMNMEDRCEGAVAAIRNLAAQSENPMAIVQVPFCLQRLVGLLTNDVEQRIQEHAIWALANLAATNDNQVRTSMLAIPCLLERVVKLLSKDMGDRCWGAVDTLRSLACAPGNLVGSLSLLRLVELLTDDVEQGIQEDAVWTLARLACSNDDRILIDMLATPHLLERVVMLLSKDMGARCEGAAAVIRNLACAPANGPAIVQAPFCLERIGGLLAPDVDKITQQPAIWALSNLARLGDNQLRIDILRSPGLLEGVLMLLSKDMGGSCKGAAAVIRDLASPSVNKVQIVQCPFSLERLVGLLDQDVDKGIQDQAMWALARLAELDDNLVCIDILRTPGLLERVVMHISKDMEGSCLAAAALIRHLARPFVNKVRIAQFPHSLERLVGLLAQDVDESIQNQAVWALASLARSDNNQVRIDILRTPGLLDRVVTILCKDMEGRCAGAAATLRHLARTPENADVIVQFPSALERLVGLLSQDVDKKIQEQAVWALSNLAQSDDHQVRINILATPGLLERVVMLLSKDYMVSSCRGAATMMENLAGESVENQVVIAGFPGALSRLVALLGEDVTASIQEAAVWTLGHLASLEGTQVPMDIWAIPGLLESVVTFLSKDMAGRCEGAAIMIQHLAVSPENQVAIVEFPFALKRLVALLAEDVMESIQEAAVWAIAYLAESEENKVPILASPCLVERLLSLMEEDAVLRCHGAVTTMGHLALAPSNQVPIGQFPGTVEKLVGLLAEHVMDSIQEVAVFTLTSLSVVPENRVSILAIPDVLKRLVALLAGDQEESCRGAAGTIENLALTSENQVPIAQFPGVIKGLVLLLGEDVPEGTQTAALGALANLAQAAGNQDSILAMPNVLQRLVSLLSADKGERCQQAAVTIEYLALTPGNRVHIVQFPHAIERLIVLLGDDVVKDNQIAAAWALANLAIPVENQGCIMPLPRLLERLVFCLSQKELCYMAAAITKYLAVLPENRVPMAHYPGVIEGLTRLLSEDIAESTQEQAARGITNLLLESLNVVVIASYPGVIEGLIRIGLVAGVGFGALYRYRSHAKVELKDYPGALTDMRKALEISPDDAFLWQEQGVLKRLMGDFPGSLADLNRSLEIKPEDYEVLKHRALVKYMMMDKEGACHDADRAIQVRPSALDDDSYGGGCLGVLSVEFLLYTLK